MNLAPGAIVEVRSAKGRMRLARILAVPLPASYNDHYDASDNHALVLRYDAKRGRWSQRSAPVRLAAIGRVFRRKEYPIGRVPDRKRGRPPKS